VKQRGYDFIWSSNISSATFQTNPHPNPIPNPNPKKISNIGDQMSGPLRQGGLSLRGWDVEFYALIIDKQAKNKLIQCKVGRLQNRVHCSEDNEKIALFSQHVQRSRYRPVFRVTESSGTRVWQVYTHKWQMMGSSKSQGWSVVNTGWLSGRSLAQS
jgi:hypothetical protein